jgi:hypothetical protein
MGLSPAAIGSRLPTMLKLLVVAVHVVSLMLLPQLCLGVRHIHASVQARLRTPAPFHSCKWWAGLGLVVAGIVKLACLSSNFKLRPRGAFFFSKSAALPRAVEPIGTPVLATSGADVSSCLGVCYRFAYLYPRKTLYSQAQRVPRQLAAPCMSGFSSLLTADR